MSRDTSLTAVDPRATRPDDPDRAVLVLYEGEGAAATTRVVDVPDGAQLTVGRARAAAIQVDSERVSRIHARFVRRGRELTVQDEESRNGTWVNGVAIRAPTRLGSGDEVVIGPATIVVSLTTPVIERPELGSIRQLEERIAAEADRGLRYRRVFSVLRVRLDGDPADLDDAIDRLAAAARPMDTLTEYAPAELVLVLPELDAAAALEHARAVAAAARARGGEPVPGLGVTIGIATFPEHGTTSGELIATAGAAVEAARRAGLPVGAPPQQEVGAEAAPVVVAPQMRRVYELARKVADHPITVLICGETGVGKEVVAAAIHRASARRDRPLVRINCASLSETLLESELFGHERGAFTGADRRKQGFFEVASGGTLFLDEIGELSADIQAKLLRVLQDRYITRVGGTAEIEVDVRVICATNRELELEAARGAFRSDLFFRVSAFTILVPPLRDRPDEIVPLAEHFLRRVASGARRPPPLSPAAAEALRRYPWPGNVRELRNAVERAYVVYSGGAIDVEDLPDRVRDVFGPAGARDTEERDQIAAALQACNGSQTEAAKRLGMTRRALIYRMEKHGLKALPASARR